MAKNNNRQHKNKEPQRPVERYFDELESGSIDPVNRKLQYVFIPVFAFSILGLVWMIPFPEIGFLKNNGYDTFLNWASFFIAIIIYYYLRLSPTLSYAILLTIGIFSYFIVQLEYVERDGGIAAWIVFAVLLLISLLALWIGKNKETQPVSLARFGRMLLIGPIWLWHFLFKAMKWPY